MKIELTHLELTLIQRLLNDKKLEDKSTAQALDPNRIPSTALDTLMNKVEDGLKAEE